MLYRYDAVNGDRLTGVSERVISGSYYCGDTNCGEGHTSGDHVTDNYMAYDAMGNPTTYKGKTLVWQLGRQLRSYDIHVFDYDGYGRRIAKGNTTYTYSANGALLKQTDGTNTMEFIYDNGTAVGVKINGTQYLYRRNLQGDITHIYGIDGTLVACYTYDAWGNHRCTSDSGTIIYDSASGITSGYETHIGNLNPYRYRSYYYDTETGLYFLQSRYYDPETGRFISADDVSYLDPESINGLNLYAYCGNNPVMRVDPIGTKWNWGAFFAGVVAVLSIVVIVVGVALCATGVGAVLGAGLIAVGVAGLIAEGSSVVSQAAANDWDFSKISWGQVAFDGIIGMASAAVGLVTGPLGGAIAGGIFGFLGSAGGDLISSGGDISKINIGKAILMGGVGAVLGGLGGRAAGIAKQNAGALAKGIQGNGFVMLTKEVSNQISRKIAIETVKIAGASAIGAAAATAIYSGIESLFRRKR